MAQGAVRRAARRERSAEQLAERKQTCANALLNRSWITKEDDPDLYYAIKDHFEELRDWFMDKAGLPLLLTRTMAKLDKTPVCSFSWMGFEEFREARDYVFFTYGLWYLEAKTEMDQFLLSEMIEEIREQMVASGVDADWSVYFHRLSMARALKKLRSLGVLIGVDGDESQWAQDKERNVLYECSPSTRYVLRRFPRDLTECRALDELIDPISYADTEEGQAMRRRHRVFRRLLFEPVLEDRSWQEQEDLNYVLWQRRALIDQLERMLGWNGRRYREGLLFFHPGLTSECELFPTLSAVSDLSLLVAGEIRKRHAAGTGMEPEADGSIVLTLSELETMLLGLKAQHGEYWSKEWREKMSSSELAALCMEHLESWRLGERNGGELRLSAVLGRWDAEYGDSTFKE